MCNSANLQRQELLLLLAGFGGVTRGSHLSNCHQTGFKMSAGTAIRLERAYVDVSIKGATSL